MQNETNDLHSRSKNFLLSLIHWIATRLTLVYLSSMPTIVVHELTDASSPVRVFSVIGLIQEKLSESLLA